MNKIRFNLMLTQSEKFELEKAAIVSGIPMTRIIVQGIEERVREINRAFELQREGGYVNPE